MLTTTTGPLLTERLVQTDEPATTTLPVATSTTMRTVLRAPVLANPGDILDVTARMQVTNDTGKNVGAGWHLWVYDIDLQPAIPVAKRPWTQIAPWTADNVDPTRHHMPMITDALWEVPPDWPAGHRAMVVLQAAAFRTTPLPGETLRVDQAYCLLTIRRLTPAPAPGS
ncbi:hypothetical protein [Streptomyces sp. NPDC060366]|uniref:hypothetical protein n=1 Tax=Streptomyces sp. NPDC060366 TaxID=3347105 RepID=UPI0036698345